MKTQFISDRRAFLKTGGFILAASAVSRMPSLLFGKGEKEDKGKEISPVEDLMREHGVLRRILLIYEEAIRRIEAGGALPPGTVAEASGIVRSFIEDYHEKLEENHLFPQFKKAGKLVDLVEELLRQHRAGRKLTDAVTRRAASKSAAAPEDRRALADSLRQFVRMYNPHAAREDTVLFPAFRAIVPPKEFDALGEEFEKEEDRLFGEGGFLKVVNKVADIEKKLGIYDLAQFTLG